MIYVNLFLTKNSETEILDSESNQIANEMQTSVGRDMYKCITSSGEAKNECITKQHMEMGRDYIRLVAWN